MSRTECANCGEAIEHDGDEWLHVDSGLARCPMEFFAIAKAGS